MKFPLINIGRENKRYKHNMDSLISTTTDFGSVFPLKHYFLPNNSHVNIQTRANIRLAPMPVPTMGSCKLETFTTFVKMKEIYDPWEYFLSGTTYTSSVKSYVPTSLPSIPNYVLFDILLANSYITIYDGSDNETLYDNGYAGEVTLDTSTSTFSDFTSLLPFSSYMGSLLSAHHCTSSSDDGFSDIGSADLIYNFQDTSSTSKIACARLSLFGKHLFKIFTGLGYKINSSSYEVCVLPLVAFYKSYFDTLVPKRDANWVSTSCFKYINHVVLNNSTYTVSKNITLFFAFILELGRCYYVSDPDFVSAHVSSINNGSGATVSLVDGSDMTSVSDTGVGYPNLIDTQGGIQTSSVSRPAIELMNQLTKLINKSSVLGKDVRQYIKSVFGYDMPDEDVKFVGSSSIDCEITDVLNTAATSEGYLGEYAGKGIGQGQTNTYNFDASGFGYLFVSAAMVPISDFCQGEDSDISMLTRFQVPQVETDCKGYESTPVSRIIGQCFNNFAESYASGFGYIPRYSGFKISNNIINGDVALPSTRESLMPYNLQRFISDSVIDKDSSDIWYIRNFNPSYIKASPYWRYIGRFKNLGNFDRIFYNQPVTDYYGQYMYISEFLDIDQEIVDFDDNFIIDAYVDCTLTNNLKSLSDSFDTDAGVGSETSVEHQ